METHGFTDADIVEAAQQMRLPIEKSNINARKDFNLKVELRHSIDADALGWSQVEALEKVDAATASYVLAAAVKYAQQGDKIDGGDFESLLSKAQARSKNLKPASSGIVFHLHAA